MKQVVITGTMGGYEFDDGREVWTCNAGYKQPGNNTRLYWLDPGVENVNGDFDDINATGLPVYTMVDNPRWKNRKAYPYEEIMQEFGIPYFTCSLAYMIAHAIYDGYKEITLHRVYSLPQSAEYFGQKPCIDCWLGFAMGRGIEIRISMDSHLMRNHPWDVGLYAWAHSPTAQWIKNNLAKTIEESMATPIMWQGLGERTDKAFEIAKEANQIKRYAVMGKLEPVKTPSGKLLMPKRFPVPQWVNSTGDEHGNS